MATVVLSRFDGLSKGETGYRMTGLCSRIEPVVTRTAQSGTGVPLADAGVVATIPVDPCRRLPQPAPATVYPQRFCSTVATERQARKGGHRPTYLHSAAPRRSSIKI